jgi:hypothetical protein
VIYSRDRVDGSWWPFADISGTAFFFAPITIEGSVTDFQFVTPHARVFLDVVGANGEVQK